MTDSLFCFAFILRMKSKVGNVFLIIALVIFSVIKAINRAQDLLKKKEEEEPVPEEDPKPTTEELLTAILEEIKKEEK